VGAAAAATAAAAGSPLSQPATQNTLHTPRWRRWPRTSSAARCPSTSWSAMRVRGAGAGVGWGVCFFRISFPASAAFPARLSLTCTLPPPAIQCNPIQSNPIQSNPIQSKQAGTWTPPSAPHRQALSRRWRPTTLATAPSLCCEWAVALGSIW